jgi:hypothetical protein
MQCQSRCIGPFFFDGTMITCIIYLDILCSQLLHNTVQGLRFNKMQALPHYHLAVQPLATRMMAWANRTNPLACEVFWPYPFRLLVVAVCQGMCLHSITNRNIYWTKEYTYKATVLENINTVNSQLSRLMKRRRQQIIRKHGWSKIFCLVHSQNFTNCFTFSLHSWHYFEKQFVMIACFCELYRLLLTQQYKFHSSPLLCHGSIDNVCL